MTILMYIVKLFKTYFKRHSFSFITYSFHIPYTLKFLFRISFIFRNSDIRRADVDGIGMLKNRGPILVFKTVTEKQRDQELLVNFNHRPLFEEIFATFLFGGGRTNLAPNSTAQKSR